MNAFTAPRAAAVTLALSLAVVAVGAAPASAKGTEYRASGRCGNSSIDWNLKAKADDGRIETEFEVDSNRNGQRWRVGLWDNGTRVYRGVRRTHAPSGSFEVERHIANRAGKDRITAYARNLSTGRLCRGVVTFPG